MISKDKQYQTKCGYEVRIYATDAGGYYPIHGAYFFDGQWVQCQWSKSGGHSYNPDLNLVEVKPRIQREYWVNVYHDCISPWDTKQIADALGKRRIACVKVTIDCEEGEGL